MPGRRLSHDERRLLEFWQNPPPNFNRPLLRQLRIEGGPGLRGIRRIVVPIPYPFTAICGRNGVGKSTVLALAALSSRSTDAWRVYWGNTRPRTRPDARTGYSFADFFHRRRGDPPLDGLRIGWVLMSQGNEIEVQRQHIGNRWTRVADPGRHPNIANNLLREIDYVPMSRVLPSGELAAVRAAFAGAAAPQIEALNADSIAKLSYILGRAYDQAETRFVRGLGLPACRSGSAYSGFDMGGGECSVITILSRLQIMPVGGLIVIEEIEVGLHAEAQARLVEVLLQVCQERRLQIVCTTHSEVILDNLPRQARVLLRRSGEDHEAIDNVSTRFAIHEMAGRAQPELLIYTEDRFAAVVIEEAITGAHRARVEIRDVGSNTTLARQSVAHLRMQANLRAISAFDGDCVAADIEGWIRDERAERHNLAPAWMILPGNNLNPERWIIQQLAAAEYRDELARELSCTNAVATAHIEAMQVQLDEHDAGHVLAQRTGLERDDARRRIIRSVARRHPQLDDLRNRVREALDGA